MSAIEARAKINLRHRVFERDARGYHGVETLLLRTGLADEVSVEASGGGIRIELDGPAAGGVPTDRGNLCWRAADRFFECAFPGRRPRPGVTIRLTKRIPSGSGLGGGSADAAAVLRLLAERWGGVEEGDLVRISGELGSDVTFALLGVPMALGWERGRRLLPLRPPRPRPALLLCPPIHVGSAEAYGWLAEGRRGGEGGSRPEDGAAVLPGATALARWEVLERLRRNDLEPPVFERHPALRDGLELLSEVAALAGMTGSGSALFAVFGDGSGRDRARATLDAAGAAAAWPTVEVELPV